MYPINSSYKYVKKVKLNPNDNPNILSEIIELQENGGTGCIQGGRSWQPFNESKNGHKTFVKSVFAILVTNVSLSRTIAKLQILFSIICNIYNVIGHFLHKT